MEQIKRFDAKTVTSIITIFIALIAVFSTIITGIDSSVSLLAKVTPTVTPTSTPIPLPTATATATPTQSNIVVTTTNNISMNITLINDKLNSLDNRLTKIEDAILDNPAKALELTILKRDMETLQRNYEADLHSIREELSRTYDQNKWFIGLMFTMAIGLLSLGVSNFLPKFNNEEKAKKKSEKELTE